MANVIFHPEARDEYEQALAWYQARSIQAAARFEEEVQRMLSMVQLNPELFPPYDDEHRFAVLRRFAYTLIYRIDPDRIYVVAVAQAGRRPGYWQGRA